MNLLNTLNSGPRGTQGSSPEALLQLGNAAAANGSRDSAFAGLLKNFDSLGANDAAAKPAESAPSPADPAPTKSEQAKPAQTQRLQSQGAAQASTTSADAPDTSADSAVDPQAAAQGANTQQPAKSADAEKDAPAPTAQAKADAADDKTTASTDTPLAKRSRKLLGDVGTGTTAAQAAAQDHTADAAATSGPVSAKPSKVGADVCELPAGTDPSAKSAAGQSAVAQAQGRAVERAQDQQVAARGQQLQAQLSELGASPSLQAAAAQSFASELKTAQPVTAGPRSGAIEGLAGAAQAGATGQATAAANDDSAAAPVIVNIAPPLDDAGFASELGARLTVLAQDGVQHAELHLNPAEMGPVAVNIKLDGQQAQVTFHAAQSDTRSVLEQGLPDLAAALAGAGLTLAGGGVFQQSQGGRERDGGQAQASAGPSGSVQGLDAAGAGAAGAGAAATSTRVVQPRGMVDIYA